MSNTGGGEVRTIIRIPTYELPEKSLKVLFTIASVEKDFIISQRFIADTIKSPITTVNYQVTKLRTKGLIDKQNQLTESGKDVIRYFNHWDKTYSKKLRAHKVQISVTIIQLPSNFWTKKHHILKPFTNSKYKGLKGTLRGSSLCFYSSKKLVVKIPDIFANNSDEIVCAIDDSLEQLFQIINDEMPGIKLGTYDICKFNSMHCAILNSTIAESFLLKEGRCYSNKEFCIDGSNGVPELEAENLETVFENIDFLVKYEDLATENKRMSELLLHQQQLLQKQEETLQKYIPEKFFDDMNRKNDN